MAYVILSDNLWWARIELVCTVMRGGLRLAQAAMSAGDNIRPRVQPVSATRRSRFTKLVPIWSRNMGLSLKVNGTQHAVDVEPETPLLWVLRDTIGLTGTKFACGIAHCGACTVHVDGKPTRSCSFPVRAAVGTEITTIEGLS